MLRTGDRIGPYTLAAKLGQGSFGVVWLAERRSSIAVTKVALKIPLDEEIDLEAIKQEAGLWAMASGHPNVLPIIEADFYDNHVVIASEYAPDGSLESWLRKSGGKAPSVEAAVEMTLGILAGLEHLHARQIIHRDLKPANILLQGEIPRLADFGISRILKTTSRSNILAGTPVYMAPEAFDKKRNEQTDIWSVGVMLYQMLSGRLPFPHSDMASLIGAVVTREPDPIDVPMPLGEVLRKALAKNPQARYRSASEMRAALRQAARELHSSAGGTRGSTTARSVATPTIPVYPAVPTSPATIDPTQISPQFPTQYSTQIPTQTPAQTPAHPPTQSSAQAPAPAHAPVYASAPAAVPGAEQRDGGLKPHHLYAAVAIIAVLMLGTVGAVVAYLQLGNREPAAPGASVTPQPSLDVRPTATPGALPGRGPSGGSESGSGGASAGVSNQTILTPFQAAEARVLAGELLAAYELRGLSQEELRLLRNTVYARHGRLFQSAVLQRYFQSRLWYVGRPSYSDNDLTANDRANVKLIQSLENE